MIKSIKKEKGITLIALAITVIVLVTLSAVVINAVAGDHGLITQGKEIRKNTEIAMEEGKTKINSVAGEQGYYEGGIVDVEDENNPTLNSLSITDVTVSSFKVSVNITDVESGVARVEYKIDEISSTYEEDPVNPQSKTHTFTGLSEATTYTVRVRITDKNGNKTEETATQTTKAIPVPTITNVSIGSVTYDSMQVTVTASSDSEWPITKYEYSSDGGSNFVSSTSSSYTFSGLSFGKTYNIVARVANSGNKTATSTRQSQTTTTPPTSTFAYTGNYQTYTVPATGTYKLEVWGAQGGYRSSSTYGGKGGYSVGTVTLTKNTKIYIYVGGQGGTSSTLYSGIRAGGYNGGGYRYGYYGGRRSYRHEINFRYME